MSGRIWVSAEEIIGDSTDAQNGTGPMWCYGSPTIVRDNNRVFATIPEVGKGRIPYSNTRWQLYCREDEGNWERVNAGEEYNEREPCPLVCLSDGRILMSVNPALTQGTQFSKCKPQLLAFSSDRPWSAARKIMPVWDGEDLDFCQHSYRGIAADSGNNEILLLNIEGYEGQHWCYMDSAENWRANGLIKFPRRACYPQVALKDRKGYVMAVSDIEEPYPAWRKFKQEVTRKSWDFDFRQLYFTYNADVTRSQFTEPITIADYDSTAGHVSNKDMWIDENGDAHIIYTVRNIWLPEMRDRFFPDTPISTWLEYCRIKGNAIMERKRLIECVETERGWTHGFTVQVCGGEEYCCSRVSIDSAMFHFCPDKGLYVFYHISGDSERGNDITGIYVVKVAPLISDFPTRLEFEHPMRTFFTACQRTGTESSGTVDMYGVGGRANEVRYAKVDMIDLECK